MYRLHACNAYSCRNYGSVYLSLRIFPFLTAGLYIGAITAILASLIATKENFSIFVSTCFAFFHLIRCNV